MGPRVLQRNFSQLLFFQLLVSCGKACDASVAEDDLSGILKTANGSHWPTLSCCLVWGQHGILDGNGVAAPKSLGVSEYVPCACIRCSRELTSKSFYLLGDNVVLVAVATRLTSLGSACALSVCDDTFALLMWSQIATVMRFSDTISVINRTFSIRYWNGGGA
jgi:hypothetical protein